MFRSLLRSGTYRSKTYCMEKAFEFLKANKAVAFPLFMPWAFVQEPSP